MRKKPSALARPQQELSEQLCRVKSFLKCIGPLLDGAVRHVEIGLLLRADPRFAQAMWQLTPKDLNYSVRMNQPYSAADGVTHTLDLHGTARNLLNVMGEIRNDLVVSEQQQQDFADLLPPWIRHRLDHLSGEQQ